jgi:hypothetical protein
MEPENLDNFYDGKFNSLRPATFTMDDQAYYEGFTDGTEWNGWACPLFPLDEGKRIAADMMRIYANDPRYSFTYDPQNDRFVQVDPNGNGGDDDPIYYTPIATERGTLYPIGAGGWIWDEVIS